jgi:hypothetical protein
MDEMREAIGKANRDAEEAIAQMNLKLQIAQQATAGQAQAPVLPPLPEGINAEDPTTWGQIHALLNNIVPHIRTDAIAQATRSMWDVTYEEEAKVLQENPGLQNTPEPERTRLIMQAVKLARPKPAAAPSPAPATGAPVAPPGPAPTRPAPATVPHVETGAAPAVSDSVPASALVKAQAEYDAADRIANPNERLTAKKAAYEKILALKGLDPNKIFEGQFRSGVPG